MAEHSLQRSTGRRSLLRWLVRGGWALATVGALLVILFGIDILIGIGYRTGRAAVIHVTLPRSGRAAQVIVVFPGYIMPGDTLSKAFAPYVGQDDAMIVAQYPDRGVNIAGLYREISRELQQLKPNGLRIYGASLGGMCAKEFLDLYVRDGSAFGQPILLLDTAPSSSAMVKVPSWMFSVASWYRGGPLSSAVFAMLSGGPRPQPEPDADRALIASAQHRGAWAGMPAVTSEAQFIANFRELRRGELEGKARRVIFIEGRDPNRDPLIRVSGSIAGWRTAFQDLQVVTLSGREGRWHIPIIERPKETMAAILHS